MMQTWALIIDCFREALDRKLFWVTVGISVLIAAAMACISFDETGVHVLFGKWSHETDLFAADNPNGRALLGGALTKYIGDIYIGFVGIIIALVATCGIFPSLMERGAVDVVLSKPMSRPMIFLGKYIGSMVFVALQATIFVVLTFLVVGLRWNYWMWGYLWCILLIVVLFSYIFAFCALFGVMTRNSMAALLLAMLAWFGIYIPQGVHEALVGFQAGEKWIRIAEVVKTVVPKTTDITHISGNLIGASTATEVFFGTVINSDQPEAVTQSGSTRQSQVGSSSPSQSESVFAPDLRGAVEAERKLADVNLVTSIGSSLLFEAVIVLIAMWKFSRRDF